ncbi:MAG: hypothetical protein IK136_03140 [Oscillospiraceae bacterium]|nr:hypothetical protein [Oscillospiraceae bacterium]
METALRRKRSALRILGIAVVAFALWSAVKPFLLMLMVQSDEMDEVFSAPTGVELAVVIGIFFLFALMGIGLRLYVGLSARAEGMGKRRRRGYVFTAFLILAFRLLLYAGYVVALSRGITPDSFEAASSLLVEIGSTLTLGATAFTALKVRKMSQQMARAG